MTANDTTSDAKQQLINQISGFRPATTGTLCDSCNRGLAEGDTVQVLAYRNDPDAEAFDGSKLPPWSLSRTHCEACAFDTDAEQTPGSAVVACELGPFVANGEAAPLYNPDVLAYEPEGNNR